METIAHRAVGLKTTRLYYNTYLVILIYNFEFSSMPKLKLLTFGKMKT